MIIHNFYIEFDEYTSDKSFMIDKLYDSKIENGIPYISIAECMSLYIQTKNYKEFNKVMKLLSEFADIKNITITKHNIGE